MQHVAKFSLPGTFPDAATASAFAPPAFEHVPASVYATVAHGMLVPCPASSTAAALAPRCLAGGCCAVPFRTKQRMLDLVCGVSTSLSHEE